MVGVARYHQIALVNGAGTGKGGIPIAIIEQVILETIPIQCQRILHRLIAAIRAGIGGCAIGIGYILGRSTIGHSRLVDGQNSTADIHQCITCFADGIRSIIGLGHIGVFRRIGNNMLLGNQAITG